MLDAERQMVNGLYRIRPNGNRQYPEGFIRDLSSVGHGSRVPPPTVHLLYALILNVNPWLDTACKTSSYANLSLVFISNLQLSCTRHRRSSCTYSVRDLCHHCYYDSHRHHHRNRTEQHKKLGSLKHYYLDEFKQTGVFIRLKRGMQNSIAIEDSREGSLPNNRPLLPTTMSVIIPRLF